MKKAELIDLYAEATRLSKKEAAEDFARLCDIMAAELLAGGEVPLPGIGKLKVQTAKARTARNPRSGEQVSVPAKKKVKFVVGKELKESLN